MQSNTNSFFQMRHSACLQFLFVLFPKIIREEIRVSEAKQQFRIHLQKQYSEKERKRLLEVIQQEAVPKESEWLRDLFLEALR